MPNLHTYELVQSDKYKSLAKFRGQRLRDFAMQPHTPKRCAVLVYYCTISEEQPV